MFTTVLAATDRVTVLDATVLSAARIADQNNAELHIIHVLESASTKNRDIIIHYKSGKELMTGSAYEETIRVEIKKCYAGLLPDNCNFKINIVAGYPWHEIKRYSKQINADLIVMGPHSTKAQEKGFVRIAGKIGSTVEEVIMREKCPVMIVNNSISIEKFKLKNILIGIDFSTSCECALKFAATLAQTYNARLFVFHMIPIPPQPEYSQAHYKADLDAANNRLREFYQDIINEIDHEYCVWGGVFPHAEILKCAEKKNVDLIVMGSHTKEKQGKWYSGSAVERVAFRSDCPVIVITDPDVLRPWEDT